MDNLRSGREGPDLQSLREETKTSYGKLRGAVVFVRIAGNKQEGGVKDTRDYDLPDPHLSAFMITTRAGS